MEKYISVYQTVCELTTNEVLRTFYTLVLMSDSLEQRLEHEQNFVHNLATMPVNEQNELKTAWHSSLKNLLVVSKVLHQDTIDFNASLSVKRQAA